MFQLYGRFGHLYDLHTPPHHYQHDHQFALDQVAALASRPRLLDVGCGTGVFVEKALKRGVDARGIDAAQGMIAAAEERVGRGVVEVRRMQDLEGEGCWDSVSALCWTLNYCQDAHELTTILQRIQTALRPGGLFIAQVAHAAGARGEWYEDREAVAGGEISLRYRFCADEGPALLASYACIHSVTGESFEETHRLNVASAPIMAGCAEQAGLRAVRLLASWRGEPFDGSLSAWLLAQKPT